MTRTDLIKGIKACRQITGRKVGTRGYCYKRTVELQRVYDNEVRAARIHVAKVLKNAGRIVVRGFKSLSQVLHEARIDLDELDAGLNNRIGVSIDIALAGKEPELW